MRLDIFGSATGPKRILIAAIIITCILIVLCPVLVASAQGIAALFPDDSNDPIDGGVPGKIKYTEIPVSSSDVYSKGTLLVVNPQTKIKVYPADDQLVKLGGKTSYTTNGTNLRLYSNALQAFNSMMDAYFMETNDKTVNVSTAYRTESDQADLKKKNPSTFEPGHSDHHLALSVAIFSLPDDHWIYQNGYKYGFVQRYPDGKASITGDTQNYSECLRFVGVPHATYMKENDLCLEEYVDKLKTYTYDGAHLTVSTEDASYEIYYVPANLTGADDAITTLPVPSNTEYSYSGNNIDGFIVTVKVG